MPSTLYLTSSPLDLLPPSMYFFSLFFLIPSPHLLLPTALLGAAYSVVAGANLAAALTTVGALSGIMFVQLLQMHGKPITYFGFLRIGAAVTPAVSLVAALAIVVMLF